MTTQDMSIAQLWKAHHANPNNAVIRNAIALRDPRGSVQLWPISRLCVAVQLGEAIERADKFEEGAEARQLAEEEVARLETAVEDMEEEIDDLKKQLATAIQ